MKFQQIFVKWTAQKITLNYDVWVESLLENETRMVLKSFV